jgi:hypothetical protein
MVEERSFAMPAPKPLERSYEGIGGLYGGVVTDAMGPIMYGLPTILTKNATASSKTRALELTRWRGGRYRVQRTRHCWST